MSEEDRAAAPLLSFFGWGMHNMPLEHVSFCSQEGDEEQGPSAVPQPAPLLSELCFRDKAVVQMAAGHRHCLFLTVDGQVYCAGGGGSGQCGQGKEEDEPVPVFLNSLPEEVLDCVYVAAGGNTSACLSSDFNAFTWGDGSAGQLGTGRVANESHPCVVSVPLDLQVEEIDCGAAHTAILLNTGEVYTCGDGEHGALGLPVKGFALAPRVVQHLVGKRIQTLACGDHVTGAVTGDGELYVWGWNCFGQLGLGDAAEHAKPVHVPGTGLGADELRVVSCSFGAEHMLICTEEGEVYAAGTNLCGQLGAPPATVPYSYHLQKVPLPCWALQVDAAARYSCALGDDGNLYFWGKAPCAPDKVLFSSPTILNPTDTTVEQFCCGTHFLLFGVREGRC